jgi:signal transduction histidine kinase
MKFKSTYLSLTGFYVLIIVVISIAFSFIIFNISNNQLEKGLTRQADVLRQMPGQGNFQHPQDLEQIKLEQIIQSKNQLRNNLIYINLLILVFSSLGGYFLAKKTLSPIKDMIEAQDRFTADASHELRTPLTVMKTEIEVNLRNKNLSLSEAKELLNSNLDEIQKLNALSNALLKLARYKDDETKNFKKVSLEEVIVEAYEKVETLAEEKEIKFANKLSDVSISADKQSLTELIVILLDNAIKYSPKKSKISISLNQNKQYAIIKIKDNGIGIKASQIPHIFDRFYRADNSRSKIKAEGYGLGLSIAKQITEFHDGTILVESKPNKGTEFTIEFKK